MSPLANGHSSRQSPLLIGHRGASGHYPENTLLAFKQAFVMGCDGIELDVQQTADGQLVVFHDWSLERTSNGSGQLRQKSLQELQTLDCSSWFWRTASEKDSKTLGDQQTEACRIPQLHQVLQQVPAGKLVNIELKEQASDMRGTAEKLAQVLQDCESTAQIIVSSFNHQALADFHRAAPQTKIGLLLPDDDADGDLATLAPADLFRYIASLPFAIHSFHPSVSRLHETELAWMRHRQIQIYPWTVNTAQQLATCKRYAVDGLITNYPKIVSLAE